MKSRVFGYDLVRAAAILLVVVGHGLGFIYAGTYSFFFSFLSGFYGVELFFILSGVLIGGLLIKAFEHEDLGFQLKNFIMRRWWRTLPMYFLMLVVYYLGNRFFDTVHGQDVPLWKYVFFVQNFSGVQPTFFGVSWSLSIEEWFYVLFPATLFLIRKLFPKLSVKTLFLVSIFLFIITFLSFRICQYYPGRYSFYEGARKIAFLRFDAISFGVFGAWVMHFYSEKIYKIKNSLFLLGIVLLLVNQFIVYKDNYSHLQYFNTVYYTILGFGVCFLFPLLSGLKTPQQWLLQGITALSQISYSLYLIHWLVFRLVETDYFSFARWPLRFIIYLLLSFVLSALGYKFIEKPVLNFREKKVPDTIRA